MKSLTFPFLLCALILYFPQRCSERHRLEVARTANSYLTSLKLLKKLPCTNDTDPPSFPFRTLSEWREEDPSNRKILEGGITLRWVYMQNTDTETISAFRFRLYWLFSCLELHLGCHACWLSYFTLVCLWWGRTVGVWSLDYQIFSDG